MRLRLLLLKLMILQHYRVSLNRGHGSGMLLRLIMVLADELLDAQLFRRSHGAAGRPTPLLLELIFVGPRKRATRRRPLRRPHILVLTRNGTAIRREGEFVIVFAAGAVAAHVNKHVVADVGSGRQPMIVDAGSQCCTLSSAASAAVGTGESALHRVLIQLDHLVVEFRFLVPLILRANFMLQTLSRSSLSAEDEDDDDEDDDGDADAKADDGDQFRTRQRIVFAGNFACRLLGEGGRGSGGSRGRGMVTRADLRVRFVAVEATVAEVALALVIAGLVGAFAVNAGLTFRAFVDVRLAFFAGVTVRTLALEVAAGNLHARAAVGAGHQ